MKVPSHKAVLRLPLCVWLLITVARQPVLACSVAVTSFEVTDHFIVDVFDRGKPVQGLSIELTSSSKSADDGIKKRVVLAQKTDENGEAAFSAVRSGYYTVIVKQEAFSKSADIFVKKHASKSAEGTITFEWPGAPILSVRSVSGLLSGQIKTERPLDDQIHPVFQPLSNAKVTLLDGVTEQVMESQTASESGAFSFQTISEGVYILHIELPAEDKARYRSIEGYIPVEIAESAKVANLNLFLRQGLCGSIGYSNEEGTTNNNAQAH